MDGKARSGHAAHMKFALQKRAPGREAHVVDGEPRVRSPLEGEACPSRGARKARSTLEGDSYFVAKEAFAYFAE